MLQGFEQNYRWDWSQVCYVRVRHVRFCLWLYSWFLLWLETYTRHFITFPAYCGGRWISWMGKNIEYVFRAVNPIYLPSGTITNQNNKRLSWQNDRVTVWRIRRIDFSKLNDWMLSFHLLSYKCIDIIVSARQFTRTGLKNKILHELKFTISLFNDILDQKIRDQLYLKLSLTDKICQ